MENSPPASPAPPPLRLLLVEDSEDDARLIARQLRAWALTLRRVTTDGELRAALAEPWDIVISDHSLPGFSGPAALAIVRETGSDAPFVIVTGTIGEESAVALMKAGVNDFLLKSHLTRLSTVVTRELADAAERRARRRAEAALRESEERYSLALRGANDGLWDWDIRAGRIFFSARWKEMLGFAETEIGDGETEWRDRLHPDERHQVLDRLVAHLKRETPHFEVEHRMRHKAAGFRWVLTRGLAVYDNSGWAYRMAGSQTDIHERKMAEQQLLHDALHDPLTGLPNRALFNDLLEFTLGHAKRTDKFLCAVLFVNIERFRFINDGFGHSAGDQFLVEIARRLQSQLRPGDVVARFGGDEFALLLDDIDSADNATRMTERLLDAVAAPLRINQHEVFPSARIGIALSSAGYQRAEDMLRDADTAMHRARKLTKSRYEVFDQAMHTTTLHQLELASALRKAIDQRQLIVLFQPIIHVPTGRIASFEALVRWEQPNGRMVSPAEFIPLAEETGLINDIGRVVLRETCQQIRRWDRQFPEHALQISVNLSSKQFAQPDLVATIAGMVRANDIDAAHLKLEITESILMEHTEAVIDVLSRLRTMRIKILLDDFGTGYSSLSYLHRFPLDTVKIDASFIQRLTESTAEGRGSGEIVRTIIVLAHNLGMDVVAEGVETPEQYARLRDWGCDFAQGFYFSRPVTGEVATRLIEQAAPLRVS